MICIGKVYQYVYGRLSDERRAVRLLRPFPRANRPPRLCLGTVTCFPDWSNDPPSPCARIEWHRRCTGSQRWYCQCSSRVHVAAGLRPAASYAVRTPVLTHLGWLPLPGDHLSGPVDVRHGDTRLPALRICSLSRPLAIMGSTAAQNAVSLPVRLTCSRALG
jgi:hypothetical protein